MRGADVLLFDLFGVLARNQSGPARERLGRLAGGSGPAFWDAYWGLRPAYDLGRWDGVEYWQRVGRKLGRAWSADDITSLREADLASWNDIDEDAVELLRELRRDRVRLGLLSNIPEELAAWYVTNCEWLRLFEVVAFSCRIRFAKPALEAYRWCADRFKAPPRDIWMVDDRPENVAAARLAGLGGYLFTSVSDLRAVRYPKRVRPVAS